MVRGSIRLTTPNRGRELADVTRGHAAASDGFLVGRRTFEEMRGFWPKRTDDRTGVTDHLNRVQKYVVSSSIEDPDWDGTTILRGGDNLASELHEQQGQDGADVVLTGSITLAHELIRLGMVEEFHLFVYPVVVGAGRRLFPDAIQMRDLRLAESRSFSAGVTLLRYTT